MSDIKCDLHGNKLVCVDAKGRRVDVKCTNVNGKEVCTIPTYKNSRFDNMDYRAQSYKKPLKYFMGIAVGSLLILSFIFLDWWPVNFGLAATVFITTVLYGKDHQSKVFVYIVFITQIVILAVYLAYFTGYEGQAYWEWYHKYDIAAHFLMGLYLYFFASTLFPNKSLIAKLAIALSFEIGYEIAEQLFGFLMTTPTEVLIELGWSVDNVIRDFLSNLCGGVLGLAFEYYFFPKIQRSVIVTIKK